MVTAGLFDAGGRAHLVFESGRVAKLAGGDDEHPLVETSVVEILDQGRDDLVVVGRPIPQIVEDMTIDRVAVPVAGRAEGQPARNIGVLQHDAHKTAAGLDKAAGQERPLAPGMITVPLAHLGRLLREIEGVAGGLAREQIVGLGGEAIHRRHRARTVDIAAKAVDAFKQRPPIGEPRGHVVGQHEVIHLPALFAGIARDEERRVGRAKVGRAECKYVNVVVVACHVNAVGQAAGDVVAHLGDD